MKLSLVVPCYNEAENVAAFQDAVIGAFAGCGYDYEIIFIDDGSKDATLHNLRKIYAEKKCPVTVVSFSRNFGKEAGIYAGLQHAKGDYVSVIDADLQQRPEIVRDMVKILDEQPEYDMVSAYQDRRGEGKVLSFFKKSFYAVINRLSDVQLQRDASDFRTFRRSVADSIVKLGEYHRFSKGIFATPLTVPSQAPLSMEILQASILEWIAIPSLRGSSQPSFQTQVFHIAGRFFTIWRRAWQPIPIFLLQFSSVTQSCLTLCDSMGCSMPGLPVLH